MTNKYIILASLGIALAQAQTPVAPTLEPVGKPRGETWGDYNITDNFETGYRFSTVGGSLSKYKSDVNYGDGIRVLSSSFSMFSRDAKGGLFDDLTITTQGLGNDPYESASLRIAKNRWYRYDMIWRSNDYINQGLSIVNGNHAVTTTHQLQDHRFHAVSPSQVEDLLRLQPLRPARAGAVDHQYLWPQRQRVPSGTEREKATE